MYIADMVTGGWHKIASTISQYLSSIGEIELTNHSFEFYGLAFFGIILARYFIMAGGTHLFLNLAFGSLVTTEQPPLWQSIRRDMKLSVLSAMIFALGSASIMSAYNHNITLLYSDIHHYPLWYLGVSYLTVIVLQDTYFYFLHRLFHHPALFRWWHQGHHRSNPPTPWTSFAFDPLEAIAQSLFLVGIIFVVPLHFITLIAVLSTMTVWAVVNHLGLDRLPVNFPHHWCGHWFTGTAHHAIHHRQYTLHYGLYFTFWDRQLGTEASDYGQKLTDITH
jgi:Delta7-sterol 5-desaturase